MLIAILCYYAYWVTCCSNWYHVTIPLTSVKIFLFGIGWQSHLKLIIPWSSIISIAGRVIPRPVTPIEGYSMIQF